MFGRGKRGSYVSQDLWWGMFEGGVCDDLLKGAVSMARPKYGTARIGRPSLDFCRLEVETRKNQCRAMAAFECSPRREVG